MTSRKNFIFFVTACFSFLTMASPLSAWTVFENGHSRPLLLEGAGDVNSRDLPESLQSSMRVDALDGTVEWRGDRGWIRAARGERMAVKNGRRVMLPRSIQFLESDVVFPEDLLKHFSDIFSFVEPAAGAEEDVLTIRGQPSLPDPSPAILPVPAPPYSPAATAPVIRTVVIDPGHGGGDPGAKGQAGAIEKDIVLAVGIALAQTLQERDPSLKVVLTRNRDEFVTLQDRAKLANTRKGDLFVSIHANSVRRNADAAGFEVYHLSIDGANDDARAVAAFENAEAPPDRASPAPAQSFDLQRILGDVMQLQYINASLELSKHVADSLSSALEGASKFRGSKGAFFYVLKDVMSPAVLVEVGFVTNEWEASFLQKPWYQRKIAAGIAEGVLNFKKTEDARAQAVTPSTPAE